MRSPSDEAIDPRSGPAPWGLFLELAVIAAGGALIFFRPLTADSVLGWGRLMLLALAFFAVTFYVERRLSRGIRSRTVGTYPTTIPIALVLLGVSMLAVGAVNRLPSHSRWVRPQLRGWLPLALPNAKPIRDLDPKLQSTTWMAVVESWRGQGTMELAFPPEEVERVAKDPTLEPEVRVHDGFLGIEYVAGVRLAPRQ